MNAVYVVPTRTPSDVSGIQKLIDEKVIAPEDIIAVLGKTEGNLIYHLVALVTVVIWGSTFVFTKLLLLHGLSPAQIFTLRFLIAYMLLVAFSLCQGRHFRWFSTSWRDEGLMLALGVTDIADALHRIPGVTLRDYGGAGGLKTIAVRGFGAKHIGVGYDGVMLSDCQSGEVDLSRYSLDNVEQLSLVIGDNDDIFIPARNASASAVLNIQTIGMPDANTKPHLTAQMKVGSFGYASPFLRYEQNLTDRFAISVVGEYTYAENDYPYEIKNVKQTVKDHRTNSRMNTGHGELNFVWNVDTFNRVSGKVYYNDNDRQLPGQVHYYTNLNKETLHDQNFFAQLLYQTRNRSGWSLKWHGKFNWYASVYKDPLYPDAVNDASYWQREAYTSVAVLYAPSEKWAFDYSLDYSFNNLNSSASRTINSHPYRHSILQSGTAKYHNGRLTALMRLLYSLYLNNAKMGDPARDMQRLSPSVSLSYKLCEDKDVFLRASYKNIFRAPTFNESYYYHYGSTDLLPESTDQYNLGITYSHQASPFSLQCTVDGYYNHVKDMIVAVPYNMFVWTCVNVGKVKVLGADLTIMVTRLLIFPAIPGALP